MGLGTESREEFYSYELAHAAHKMVTEVAPVHPGQQVVITADTASDARLALQCRDDRVVQFVPDRRNRLRPTRRRRARTVGVRIWAGTGTGYAGGGWRPLSPGAGRGASPSPACCATTVARGRGACCGWTGAAPCEGRACAGARRHAGTVSSA